MFEKSVNMALGNNSVVGGSCGYAPVTVLKLTKLCKGETEPDSRGTDELRALTRNKKNMLNSKDGNGLRLRFVIQTRRSHLTLKVASTITTCI